MQAGIAADETRMKLGWASLPVSAVDTRKAIRERMQARDTAQPTLARASGWHAGAAMNSDYSAAISEAAAAIRSAEALLIGAGAGMGVDSGLPDFRGNEGFWKAYPPLRKLGLSFT